ncbi:nitroreductase family deazaflavin-dependent oxidoreductase [Nocardia sp. CDC159]|uniref:Nitroreductase family deazaflavin-dependent oxidoreductase n=1 Tax=Nocardia pulmonis TaxID=2951408 RepID=A0A9X2E713_9NOCA|nr:MULTISPECIES: nitroreductase family deazaflavin-dependent oxidoreductase [Nocardia]MCM6775497.1 nitroreductase family deazaflavin-dependent oxidoreductase [Nocardia pulmonis]MCM6787769.1 nitroreductase family deazaflavin-dependent oxidoreductase [Nocardia sp. CDC159]
MPLPQALARFNRRVTNRIASPVAGRSRGFGVVVHKGRKSGRIYRTPVTIFVRDGAYRIALTYGREVDWVKNILAAGTFELETGGQPLLLTDPVVRHDPAADWAPAGVRQLLRLVGAEYYLEARPA